VRDVDLERQVRVDVRVQVDQSVFDERHDPGAGHGLGHRCKLEHGVACRADPPLPVGPADTRRPHDLVPSNHRDRDTRSVRLDELPMQVLLEFVRPC
jgi:hypothetical protein